MMDCRLTCCDWWAAHRPGRDIVIPVYISTGSFSKFGFTRSPLHPAATQRPRQQTFFFAGRICGDRKEPALGEWPNCKEGQEYSANARQMVRGGAWKQGRSRDCASHSAGHAAYAPLFTRHHTMQIGSTQHSLPTSGACRLIARGVLQVHYYHQNRSNYVIMTRTSHYDRHLRSSRFCLAPLGGGHGQRQIVVASMGCIPVTIGILGLQHPVLCTA